MPKRKYIGQSRMTVEPVDGAPRLSLHETYNQPFLRFKSNHDYVFIIVDITQRLESRELVSTYLLS